MFSQFLAILGMVVVGCSAAGADSVLGHSGGNRELNGDGVCGRD